MREASKGPDRKGEIVMKKPVKRNPPGAKVSDTPAGAGLSWREFFERLGDGTLHDHVAAQERRTDPDQYHSTSKRPAATASR